TISILVQLAQDRRGIGDFGFINHPVVIRVEQREKRRDGRGALGTAETPGAAGAARPPPGAGGAVHPSRSVPLAPLIRFLLRGTGTTRTRRIGVLGMRGDGRQTERQRREKDGGGSFHSIVGFFVFSARAPCAGFYS